MNKSLYAFIVVCIVVAAPGGFASVTQSHEDQKGVPVVPCIPLFFWRIPLTNPKISSNSHQKQVLMPQLQDKPVERFSPSPKNSQEIKSEKKPENWYDKLCKNLLSDDPTVREKALERLDKKRQSDQRYHKKTRKNFRERLALNDPEAKKKLKKKRLKEKSYRERKNQVKQGVNVEALQPVCEDPASPSFEIFSRYDCPDLNLFDPDVFTLILDEDNKGADEINFPFCEELYGIERAVLFIEEDSSIVPIIPSP